MTKIVEVAAAILLRAKGKEYLLAQRPEGKVYAGYWEFPGGKVEPGESVRQALIRELQEELGITVTACTPWLTRQFSYPHATVRLHFWKVTAWDGEIGISAPLEHAAISWQTAGKTISVTPVLPANGPIIKGLSLPTRMAITMAEMEGCERQLERLEMALNAGLRLIQLRDKSLPKPLRLAFATAVTQMARQHGALVLINDDPELVQQTDADGLHLSASQLAHCEKRPAFDWVGASCHSAAEIARAGELELDYALLGPVLPTLSHPDNPGIGWTQFELERAATTIPIFALGGMQPALETIAQGHGAHGIALMRGW